MYFFLPLDEVLEGHVISIHKVFSELDCLHKCLIHYKCMSLNFQLQSSHSRHACELNDVTRALSGHPLKIRNGFSYWEPILPQQVSNVGCIYLFIIMTLNCSGDWATTVLPSGYFILLCDKAF